MSDAHLFAAHDAADGVRRQAPPRALAQQQRGRREHPPAAGAQPKPVGLQRGQVRVGVQGGDVGAGGRVEGRLGLRPVQPLEADVREGGRQRVAVVDLRTGERGGSYSTCKRA